MLNSENKILQDNLCFAGTIYDSFEAMEEVMGKLKLERPLFMIYLAKKAFAEEVLSLNEKENIEENYMLPDRIELKQKISHKFNQQNLNNIRIKCRQVKRGKNYELAC